MNGVWTTPMSKDPQHRPLPTEPPAPHEDLAFVRAALDGDDAAIRFMAERARIVPRVLRALNRRWGGPLTEQDIEDLAQDVVLFVLQKLEAYKGLSPFDAWLYRFCSLQLRNRVRRETFRRRVVTSEDAEPTVQRDPTDQIDGKFLWTYVDELEAAERDVIRAKHLEGLSFTEISERLGTASSSIKTRYYRGLEQLRLRVRTRTRERGPV